MNNICSNCKRPKEIIMQRFPDYTGCTHVVEDIFFSHMTVKYIKLLDDINSNLKDKCCSCNSLSAAPRSV